jgi:ribosome-binding protein aMBF1 (putative translation factor)
MTPSTRPKAAVAGQDGQGERARDPDSIGEGIRRERLRRGLTLAQLAAQVNLTVSALSQIERGASDPSISSSSSSGRPSGRSSCAATSARS